MRKMSIALFNAVPAGAIELLFDEQDQPWFKRAHVRMFLALSQIEKSLNGLNSEESRPRSVFGPAYSTTTIGWSGPIFKRNKTDVFLSVYGVMHAIVSSRKQKGKLIDEKHQKAIEEKQRAIDEKDMQITLLDDDLAVYQDHVRQLEFNSTRMQGEIRAKD